jgi:ATP synthase protein I
MSDDEPQKPSDPNTGDLSDRLQRVEAQLNRVRSDKRAEVERQERPARDNRGFAMALRLSSEFIAGVIVGGGLGWLIDRGLGTSPWGLIVCVLLGFVAGVLNVMRAAGMAGQGLGGTTLKNDGPPNGKGE